MGIHTKPVDRGTESLGTDRHDARPSGLRRRSPERDLVSIRIDILDPDRQHFATADTRVECQDDQRSEMRRRRCNEALFLVRCDPTVSPVVLTLELDDRYSSSREWRAREVLPTDRPVQHAAQILDRSVDGRGAWGADGPAEQSRLSKLCLPVLYVAGANVRNRRLGEALEQWLDPPLELAGRLEAFACDVSLLVDFGELAKGHRLSLGDDHATPKWIEGAGADRHLEIVEDL